MPILMTRHSNCLNPVMLYYVELFVSKYLSGVPVN